MHTSLDDLSLILGEISLFRALPGEEISEIAHAAEVISLGKGCAIYAAGDRPRALYHVMSGHLKVSVSSRDGGEKVIEILSPRQLFGVSELFGDAPCVSSVETVTPVVLLAVGRDAILRAIERDQALARRMLGAMAQRQSSIERDIAADCFQSGTDKVVDYLRRLADSAAKSGRAQGRVVEIELEIPKYVLAARMGFTPETLSRIFRELSDAGMIHVHGKLVTLLEAFAHAPGARPLPVTGRALTPSCAGRAVGSGWFSSHGAGRTAGLAAQPA